MQDSIRGLLIALLLGLFMTFDATAVETKVTTTVVSDDAEWVVFLHGLARSGKSMRRIAAAFQDAGYNTCIVDYPSTDRPIETLARDHVAPAIREQVPGDRRVHFVTHSMGGILVRQLDHDAALPRMGRVVMLSPPNGGSEVVDKIGGFAPFGWVNGPAGRQLGTGADSVPNRLGPVGFELGVITGRRSINWILSTMIDGPDDGKVSVERAKIEGMSDFRVIAATHPFIMKKPEAIQLALQFMATGSFAPRD
ncbi:MAG: esterase/lipase family protein [Woeseiaceae bacterium]